MSEPLHLQPDPRPPIEHVQLGDRSYEVDPEAAAAFRSTINGLAQQYQNSLDQYRQQALQSIGTNQPMPVAPEPPAFAIPDPDLLFANKQAWQEGVTDSLEQRLAAERQQNVGLVQQAVGAFQAELARRDAAQAAQAKHDTAMEEMLERRGLSENTRVVQAIYNEKFNEYRNLPLEMALDRIGAEAEDEITRIRHGEKWTMERGPRESVAPKAPPVVRSSRRAAPAPAPVIDQGPPGGASPGGGLGQMGMIIRKRQEQLLRGAA